MKLYVVYIYANTLYALQEYSAFPGQLVNLSIAPYDSLNKLTAFVFGFTQSIDGSGIPTGRIARYLDLSSNENVCIIYTRYVYILYFFIFLKSKERVTFLSNIVEYIPGLTIPFEYRLPRNNQQLSNFTVAVYNTVKVDVSDVCIMCTCMCTICGNLYTHRYPSYI